MTSTVNSIRTQCQSMLEDAGWKLVDQVYNARHWVTYWEHPSLTHRYTQTQAVAKQREIRKAGGR